VILLFAGLSGGAAFDQAWGAAVILSVVAIMLTLRMLWECAAAMSALLQSLKEYDMVQEPEYLTNEDTPLKTRKST
jgi:hypothetical protein